MHPMKPITTRTSEREPGLRDCVVGTLDKINHAMRGQLDQMPWAGVRLRGGTFFGSHELKDRRVPQRVPMV
jgi:hypothetical protein